MNYSVNFWNLVAKRYAKSPVANQAAYEKKLEVSQTYFRPDMHVLEFACGTGSTALIHAPYVKQYEAIDVSPRMIDICQHKITEQPISNLHFSCASFEEFSPEEVGYDAILGMSILHLANEPEEVISKVFKLLKPGGIFISSTACIKDSMRWFAYVAAIGHGLRLLPKLQVFSKQELENMLLKAGFEIDYRMESESKGDAYFLVAIKPQ